MTVPKQFQVLIQSFAPTFTRPSFLRIMWITVAAILTVGSRTVSNLIRTLETFSFGHASSFHRLFSKRRWKNWSLGRTLCHLILQFIREDEPVYLAGDDTVGGHKGKRVYGKGCHRDAVRSSHKRLVFRWGLEHESWLTLLIDLKSTFVW